MKRSRLQRGKPLKARPKRRSVEEREESALWRESVLRSAQSPLRSTQDPEGWLRVEAHHCITQQQLRRRARDLGLEPHVLLWDARVGVAVTERRHARHHARSEPILRAELPASVFVFAEEYDLMAYVDRVYPSPA